MRRHHRHRHRRHRRRPPPPAPIRVGGNVQQAALINQVQPQYPPLARQARVTGIVILEAIIGRDGAVRDVRVITGHALLAPAAVKAVEQWRYNPTVLNGEPVEVVTTVTVNFSFGG